MSELTAGDRSGCDGEVGVGVWPWKAGARPPLGETAIYTIFGWLIEQLRLRTDAFIITVAAPSRYRQISGNSGVGPRCVSRELLRDHGMAERGARVAGGPN